MENYIDNSVVSTMLNQHMMNEIVIVGVGPSSSTTKSLINLRLSSSTTW